MLELHSLTEHVAKQLMEIASIAHEANAQYCRTLGDYSQLPWDQAPENIRASAVDGVVAVLAGRVRSPADSHRSWLAFKRADGWVYGEVKDSEKKTHPCLVEFEDLPKEQQLKDHLFLAVTQTLLRAHDLLRS